MILMILVLKNVIVGKPNDAQWPLTTLLFPFNAVIKIDNIFQSAWYFMAI